MRSETEPRALAAARGYSSVEAMLALTTCPKIVDAQYKYLASHQFSDPALLRASERGSLNLLPVMLHVFRVLQLKQRSHKRD